MIWLHNTSSSKRALLYWMRAIEINHNIHSKLEVVLIPRPDKNASVLNMDLFRSAALNSTIQGCLVVSQPEMTGAWRIVRDPLN